MHLSHSHYRMTIVYVIPFQIDVLQYEYANQVGTITCPFNMYIMVAHCFKGTAY